MSEEIKYEAVFGDQSLFDNAPLGTELVGHSGGFYKNSPDGPIYCGGCTFTTDEYRNIGFIAARRIIRTPTWTVDDLKSGKLPEVGSKAVSVNDFCVVEVLAVRNRCVVVCNSDVIDSRPCVFTVDNFLGIFKPIESPEEKAARLRAEWCERALKLINKEISDACDASVIYDALLSGELEVPKEVDQS